MGVDETTEYDSVKKVIEQLIPKLDTNEYFVKLSEELKLSTKKEVEKLLMEYGNIKYSNKCCNEKKEMKKIDKFRLDELEKQGIIPDYFKKTVKIIAKKEARIFKNL